MSEVIGSCRARFPRRRKRLDSPDALEQGEEENFDCMVREQEKQSVRRALILKKTRA